MGIFGMAVENIYLLSLIISGVLILLLMLFGDFLDGIGESGGFFNPTLILAFIIITSAAGYLFEVLSSWNSVLILIVSSILSLFITTLLNVFVLIPLSSAEESLAYTESSLSGRLGTVIVPIPKDGFGEVLIENESGRIAKAAASHQNKPIEEGLTVLIIESKNGVLYVQPYETY
ncbi:hypothetical protein J9303_02755 [Bacillaceae bacterium Marseille-Q3522]|nr:hypothetical protein [Bacillaceae bacterium Marseille-Q3522]